MTDTSTDGIVGQHAVFFGDTRLGGFQMRGIDVCNRLNRLDVVHDDWCRPTIRRPRFAVLVKYLPENRELLEPLIRHGSKIVLDPLDNWWQQTRSPVDHFAGLLRSVPARAIISTSPACNQVMIQAAAQVDSSIRVWMLPHGPDNHVGWFRDPDGPVMYCGHEGYLGGLVPEITEACRRVGKGFLRAPGIPEAVSQVIGVSLLLHPRLGSTATEINRLCKPQVKLANAAAAKLPVLATDDPAVTSLSHNAVPLRAAYWADVDSLANAMSLAIDAPAIEGELANRDYGYRLMSLLETL